MQPIKMYLDQQTYVRLVNSAFDEGRTIPEQAAELVGRALALPPSDLCGPPAQAEPPPPQVRVAGGRRG